MVFGIIKEVKLMKSIKKNVNNEIIINKSKFITKLIRIKSNDDAKNKLNMLKKEYADSTHICYGYIIEEYKKASDNGEPSGTAGKPILSALEHNDLNYILGAVIRYYGGVKLGTGGLVRAYTETAKLALVDAWIVERQLVCESELNFEYHHHGKIQNYLLHQEGIIIRETQFSDKVSISIYYDPSLEIEILNQVIEMTANQIMINKKEDQYITVKDGNVLETHFTE